MIIVSGSAPSHAGIATPVLKLASLTGNIKPEAVNAQARLDSVSSAAEFPPEFYFPLLTLDHGLGATLLMDVPLWRH